MDEAHAASCLHHKWRNGPGGPNRRARSPTTISHCRRCARCCPSGWTGQGRENRRRRRNGGWPRGPRSASADGARCWPEGRYPSGRPARAGASLARFIFQIEQYISQPSNLDLLERLLTLAATFLTKKATETSETGETEAPRQKRGDGTDKREKRKKTSDGYVINKQNECLFVMIRQERKNNSV